MFVLKTNYVKVLAALRSGTPKTSKEICQECNLDRLDCSGAISILRRMEALAQAGDQRYRITERGIAMFDRAPLVQIEPRSLSPPRQPAAEPGVNQHYPQHSATSSPPAQRLAVVGVDRYGNPILKPVKDERNRGR